MSPNSIGCLVFVAVLLVMIGLGIYHCFKQATGNGLPETWGRVLILGFIAASLIIYSRQELLELLDRSAAEPQQPIQRTIAPPTRA